MIERLIICFLIIAINGNIYGQTYTFNNVSNVHFRNVDAIIENKQVLGYYAFIYKDKADRKHSVYELTLMDANLMPTHNIELIKEKKTGLLEASFNGTMFCFSFINFDSKSIEYQIIDKKAKIIGSYFVKDISYGELQNYANLLQDEEDTYSGSLMAAEGLGFIRYGYEKKSGYKYEIELIDNNGNKVWNVNSGNVAKKSFETIQSFYCNNNLLVSLASVREKGMSSDINYHLLFTNVSNGKEIGKIDCENDKGYIVPMGINYDESTKKLNIYGEFYGKKGSLERFDPENKIGFFMMVVDENAKTLEEHFVDWNNDITKLIPLNSKGRMEGNFNVYVHNLVKTSDNKYFVVGEQFKKTASVVGILNVMNQDNNVSTVKVNLRDMIVFEFDNNFTPSKVDIVEKDETKILLPKGASLMPINMLGAYIKQHGWFDYSFTYVSDDNTFFNSTYVNYDKEKGEGKRYVVGNIVYKNKELKVDRIPLTTKPTRFAIMPAKPGYVVIIEYFRKTKELTVRLEKLDV